MPEQPWWYDTPHELEGLQKGVIKKLVRAGLTTAQQVRDAGPERLLKDVDGLGKKGLDDVKTWLRSLDGQERAESQE
jgi:hypothetical protein